MEDEDEELARALAMSLERVAATVPSAVPQPVAGERGLEFQSSSPVATGDDTAQRIAQQWYPNLDLIQVLLSMGISENAAKRALYHTGNTSADLAASWVFEHLEDPHLHDPFEMTYISKKEPIPAQTNEERRPKMVLVVNTSLGMGVGKIASQVAHATLALYKNLILHGSEYQFLLDEWESEGAKKIVLKGKDHNHLALLQEEAIKRKVASFLIKDAGKTQIVPGSITVLGLFGRSHLVDEISGKLSLL